MHDYINLKSSGIKNKCLSCGIVKVKDQEQVKDVLTVRDADGKWAVMPEETTED